MTVQIILFLIFKFDSVLIDQLYFNLLMAKSDGKLNVSLTDE